MDRSRAILVLDGGMGHELKARIPMQPGQEQKFFLAGNLANVDHPEKVTELHREYLEAGADAVTTNNFVSVPSVLEDFGLGHRLPELTRGAGECARRAVDQHAKLSGRLALVIGSLPPLTACYLPDLVGSVDEMRAAYSEIVRHLEPYVDIFLAETLSTSREAVAALDAVVQHSAKPMWVSWTLQDSLDGLLRGGETVAEAAASLLGQKGAGRLEALLLNCCAPQAAAAALPKLRAALPQTLRTGAYANAFRLSTSEWLASAAGRGYCRGCRGPLDTEPPRLAVEEEYDAEGIITPEAYAAHAEAWRAAGAEVFGGCCGTLPVHIAHVRRVLGSACLVGARGAEPDGR